MSRLDFKTGVLSEIELGRQFTSSELSLSPSGTHVLFTSRASGQFGFGLSNGWPCLDELNLTTGYIQRIADERHYVSIYSPQYIDDDRAVFCGEKLNGDFRQSGNVIGMFRRGQPAKTITIQENSRLKIIGYSSARRAYYALGHTAIHYDNSILFAPEDDIANEGKWKIFRLRPSYAKYSPWTDEVLFRSEDDHAYSACSVSLTSSEVKVLFVVRK